MVRSLRIRKTIGAVLAIGAAVAGVALAGIVWSIHAEIAKYSALAQHAYPHPHDDVAALVDLMNSAPHDLHQRNLAVWTLGRLANSRALPALEANYTGKLCDHDAELCQYELEKAVKRCGGHPVPRQTHAQASLGRQRMIMTFIVPVSIVMALGAISGAFWHRALNRYWLASGGAAITTGALWIVGCEVFLRVAAPSEAFTGVSDLPYAAVAFSVTSLVGSLPALLVGLLIRKQHPHSDHHSTDQG